MTDLTELSARDAAEAIRRRETSSAELTRALLDRIEQLEPTLRAWVVVDGERALREAQERDQNTDRTGLLHGVPIGVKDIFDVSGLPTAAGFQPFADRVADRDATSVARLREAGAVVLGKTVTTQFAYMDPPPTRNPWSLERTPGGSSSGSGAAVAARQIPLALGSQTGGSVLRPAAYCGVVGLKPTYGRISRAGVLPLAWTLDHVGAFARTVDDVAIALQAMAGHDPLDPATSRVPVADYITTDVSAAPRLLVLEDFVERGVDETREHFERLLGMLSASGVSIRRGRFPSGAGTLIAAHAVVMQSETASVHRRLHLEMADQYADRIRAYVETGALIPAMDYLDAERLRRKLRVEAEQLLKDVDCLVLPTVSSVAPAPDTTGDPTFQGPFSLLGLPALTVPIGLSSDGLPLGLQLVGRPWDEATVLAVARRLSREIPRLPEPTALPAIAR